VKYAEELIKENLSRLNDQFKAGSADNELKAQKRELETVLFLIELSKDLELNKSTISNIIKLPESNTGYSEYRVVNDCETDKRDQWIELTIDGKAVRLNSDDIIIQKKV
jgi:hypothetical protein